MKINIVNTKMLKMYRIDPSDEFDVLHEHSNGNVSLDNGWAIRKGDYKVVDDFDLHKLVDEEISIIFDEEMAFTAFDITAVLRKANPDRNIKHFIVKDIVHDIMTDVPTYKRQLIDVGTPVEPWLYYPDGYDPKSYKVGDGAQVLELDYHDNDNDNDNVDLEAIGVQVTPPPKVGKIRRFFYKLGL